jgi:hypothetical protein
MEENKSDNSNEEGSLIESSDDYFNPRASTVDEFAKVN